MFGRQAGLARLVKLQSAAVPKFGCHPNDWFDPSKRAIRSMDIQRPSSVARKKKLKQMAFAIAGLLVVGLVSVVLARLKPAAPTVERATVWVDTVKRGAMLRQVRGLGTLVPVDEARRWIAASTQGRVDRIVLRPGAEVTPDTVVLELSDPLARQLLDEAEQQFLAAEADFASLEAQLQTDTLNQRSAAATVEADFQQARLEKEVNEDLAKDGLVSNLILKQSTVRADSLAMRNSLEQERVKVAETNIRAQLKAQQARIDQLKSLVALRSQQVDQLRVRAGMHGVLEQVPVEVGQQVAPGANLARVADPTRLKAELRIAETQARDLTIGQVAQVDTRNGIIPGRVIRIDPAAQNGTVTVDVQLEGELPRGARPDLSVDGTVELERLDNVLYVGRPAFGQEQSTVGLFKLDPATGEASRMQVQLGRSSVNTIEVMGGLAEGDQVVLSDMSAWDQFDRIRLR
jgi:HlyD family secretion protein